MNLVLRALRFYKLRISARLPQLCRFNPTCSEFMYLSVEKYGVRGVLMGLRQLARCHPFHGGNQ